MARRKFYLQNGRMGSALAIKVIPNSADNKLTHILDDGTLIIELRTPNAKGNGNMELIKFLAEIFDIIDSEIEIIAGEEGLDKLVAILDVEADELESRIKTYWL
jgi:uncharacterized protein (TIGR00251 family)